MEARLREALYKSVSLGVDASLDMLGNVGVSFDYTMVLDEALDWARTYSYELVNGITDTGREVVRRAVVRNIEQGKHLDSLVRELMQVYGKPRAHTIASTEITRAFFEGQKASFKATGVIKTMEWRTCRDELVCPICRPRHKTRTSVDGKFSNLTPPGHPRCRCWVAPVVERDNG